MLKVVGVGKKNLEEEEELFCTGTQEIPTLKSAQKSPSSYRFEQPAMCLSNKHVAWPCYKEQSYKKTSR